MRKTTFAALLITLFNYGFAMNIKDNNNNDKTVAERKQVSLQKMISTKEITIAHQTVQELITFFEQKEQDESQQLAPLLELKNIIEGDIDKVYRKIDAMRPLLSEYFLSTVSSLQLEAIRDNIRVGHGLPQDIPLLPDTIYTLIGQMAVINYINLEIQKSQRPD